MTALQSEERERGSVTGTPVWLKLDPEPVYAVLHTPAGARCSRTAALILPTFGWEGECSYRARRDWAIAFCEAGVTTVRFDFPGTEDSVGSPDRPGRFQTWIDATTDVARWLRHESGCERLVVVGIGLGGIIGYQAVADGALIDDLVLWSVRASGRTYIREQQAFAAVATGAQPDARDIARPDGVVGLAGHRISSETVAAISAVDLAGIILPDAERRRVLLIGRDSGGVDKRLQDHIKQSGADVTVLQADDYRLLVMVPDMGRTPAVTIERSVAWWVGGSGPSADQPTRPPSETQTQAGSRKTVEGVEAAEVVEFESHGAKIRERLLEVGFGSERLFAVLAEPVAGALTDICVVSVNSAWLRRTGPNRLAVELTRRAAAEGLAAVRLDLPGLGDSEGTTPKIYERYDRDNADAVAALAATYDHLEASNVASRFVSVGLCLGGYVAALSATDDRRSVGFIGLNPQLAWVERQRQWQRRWAHDLGAIGAAQSDTDSRRRPKVIERAAAEAQKLRARVESALAPRLGRSDLIQRLYWFSYNRAYCRQLKRLGESGVGVLLACGSAERLVRDVAASGPKSRMLARWPNLRLTSIATSSHLFHPLWSQDELMEVVSSYLGETITAAAGVRAEPNRNSQGQAELSVGPVRKEEAQRAS